MSQVCVSVSSQHVISMYEEHMSLDGTRSVAFSGSGVVSFSLLFHLNYFSVFLRERKTKASW